MAQAFVFDAHGTLCDVHSVVTALRAVTTESEAISRLWINRAGAQATHWGLHQTGCYDGIAADLRRGRQYAHRS
jgi:hypothetical protein